MQRVERHALSLPDALGNPSPLIDRVQLPVWSNSREMLGCRIGRQSCRPRVFRTSTRRLVWVMGNGKRQRNNSVVSQFEFLPPWRASIFALYSASRIHCSTIRNRVSRSISSSALSAARRHSSALRLYSSEDGMLHPKQLPGGLNAIRPKGEKRPANVIGNAVRLMRMARRRGMSRNDARPRPNPFLS